MNWRKPTGGCANGDKVKSTYQKRMLKTALLVWLIPLGIWLAGCAHVHKLDCTDIASHAGHSAEMRIGGPVWVAVDDVHAQAYIDTGGAYPCWLKITNGFLILNSRCELESINARYSLENWDYLMREIWSR